MDRKQIGNKLRELRLEKNFSLKAVSSDTGIPISTMSKIENGAYNFNIEMITTLAQYYGTSFGFPAPGLAITNSVEEL